MMDLRWEYRKEYYLAAMMVGDLVDLLADVSVDSMGNQTVALTAASKGRRMVDQKVALMVDRRAVLMGLQLVDLKVEGMVSSTAV